MALEVRLEADDGDAKGVAKEVIASFNLLLTVSFVLMLLLVNFAFNVQGEKGVEDKIRELEKATTTYYYLTYTNRQKELETIRDLGPKLRPRERDRIGALNTIVSFFASEFHPISIKWLTQSTIPDSTTSGDLGEKSFVDAMTGLDKKFDGWLSGDSASPKDPIVPAELADAFKTLNIELDDLRPAVTPSASPNQTHLTLALRTFKNFLNFRAIVMGKIVNENLQEILKPLQEKIDALENSIKDDERELVARIRELQELFEHDTGSLSIEEIRHESQKQLLLNYNAEKANFEDKMDGKIKIFDVETPIILVVPFVPILIFPIYSLFFVYYRLCRDPSIQLPSLIQFNNDILSRLFTSISLLFPIIVVAVYYILKYLVFPNTSVYQNLSKSIFFVKDLQNSELFAQIITLTNILASVIILFFFIFSVKYRFSAIAGPRSESRQSFF